MRLFLCLVSLFLGLSYCLPTRNTKLDTEWELFKSTHGRNYTKEEDTFRRKVWEQNLKLIEEHNHQYKVGNQSYYLEMNAFGDKTDEEFNVLMSQPITQRTRRHTKTQGHSPLRNIPRSVDWRKQGFQTPVVNQGSCGSCWAFSATGALEGHLFLKTGKLVELSKQQLLDCTERSSCAGGFMTEAYDYIIQQGGITTEFCYPYQGQENEWCYSAPRCPHFTLRDYEKLPHGDEEALIEAVATVGPLSVAMHATQSFRFYRGGFFSDPSCDPNLLNHAVVLIGYGEEESNNNLMKLEENSCSSDKLNDQDHLGGRKYWIIKNSFGEAWGENGYMRLARTGNNHCGIASDSLYPVV